MVYFVTNREPLPNAKRPTQFGPRFSDAGLASLRFGRVSLDPEVKLRVEPERLTPDAAKLKLGSSAFFAKLQDTMRRKHSDVVVYVHGYNNTFESAVRHAQQLGDTVLPDGALIAAFCWPSDGSLMPFLAYRDDRHDAAASGLALARTLLKLTDFLHGTRPEDACAQRLHLIAHSMGNYVLRHALQALRVMRGDRLPRLFDQVVLLAPDEDDDAFEHDYKLALLPRLSRRVHVYFHEDDRALQISDYTKGNIDRLGSMGPRTPRSLVSNVTGVNCSEIDTGVVNHNYGFSDPTIVTDLRAVLGGVAPDRIPGRRYIAEANHYRLEPASP